MTARSENADFVGLSGLITPSLDEMIHVAKEMNRQGFEVPLLIGGATTSAAHTAIKMAEHYDHPMIQVGDASLVVEVCTKLKSPTLKADYVRQLRESQRTLKQSYDQNRNKGSFLSLTEARAQSFKIDWETVAIPKAPILGPRVLESMPLQEISEYIDWSPFFWSWELKGKYPAILNHPQHGSQASQLFHDAKALLDQIITEKRFTLRGIYGYYPATQVNGEDIEITTETGYQQFHFLRQQKEKVGDKTYYSLADFVAPKVSGKTDLIGAFCVTAGSEVETFAQELVQQHDDYSSIIIKALGDRMAEAAAEWLHEKVRRELGFIETRTLQDLLDENYPGIRPALGYPACPDHSEKETLWKLLQVDQKIGVHLTSSFAMTPPSSVSGLYFFNPEARYFNVGPITDEQLQDYVNRKGILLSRGREILSPNL